MRCIYETSHVSYWALSLG